MGDSSVLAHINRARVIDLMAEVACASAHKANEILESFPEYREAKDDPRHSFWITSAPRMCEALIQV